MLTIMIVWPAIYHVAIPNTSATPRVGTIAGFTAGGAGAKIPEAHLQTLDLTPHRKQAFELAMTEDEKRTVEADIASAERYVARRTGGNSN
jgi:hypothetical protein